MSVTSSSPLEVYQSLVELPCFARDTQLCSTSSFRCLSAFGRIERANDAADDAETYDGAPASVQIFAPRLTEERLLSMAQLVVDALESYKRKHGESS